MVHAFHACVLCLWLAVPMSGQESQALTAREPMARGQRAESADDDVSALAAYDRAVELTPHDAAAYLLRGDARFKLGQVDASIRDFDHVIELAPDQHPYLWQRALALYFAGRYDDCARQLELHRTVNPNDVENAAWHFLCRARIAGLEAARRGLLPVGVDRRIPMAEIYRLYSGEIEPEAVLARARAAPDAQRTDALFYAHLYLGLFAGVSSEPTRAHEHFEAAVSLDLRHYMAAVANVALDRDLVEQ